MYYYNKRGAKRKTITDDRAYQTVTIRSMSAAKGHGKASTGAPTHGNETRGHKLTVVGNILVPHQTHEYRSHGDGNVNILGVDGNALGAHGNHEA